MRGRIALLVLLLVAAGCSAAPERTPPPDGLTANVMQYRGKRLTREIAVAVKNGTDREVSLTSMRLTSSRWSETVEWDGAEDVGPGFGTGIHVDPPPGECPDGSDLAIEADLTYGFGDEERRSTVAVSDPHDVLRDLVDGDCGRQAFQEATTVAIGEPVVTRDHWRAEVRLTPTGDRSDVVLLGFAPTMRFDFGPRTPTEVELDLSRPQRVLLDVTMGRCDPHIVAEDKIGSRFGARVRTDGIEHAYFTLDLDERVHTSLVEFYAERCRL